MPAILLPFVVALLLGILLTRVFVENLFLSKTCSAILLGHARMFDRQRMTSSTRS